MTGRNQRTLTFALAAVAACLVAGTVQAQITLTSTTFSSTSSPISGTFNAFGSSKLVVVLTGEHGNPGWVGDATSVTYDGVPLIKAVNRDAVPGPNPPPNTGSTDQLFGDIWYLDNPTTSTGAISITASTRAVVTAFALSGTKAGVGNTVISGPDSKSVNLTTTAANSIVIASHNMGGNGNTANVGSVNTVSPLIETSAISQGSSWNGHVTGYAIVATPGSATYSFTGGNLAGTHTLAAEFLAAVAALSAAADPFGNVRVGTNASANLTLSNSGDIGTTLTGVNATAPSNGPFTGGPYGPFSIAIGAPQIVTYSYAPTALTNATGATVSVTSSNGGNTSATLQATPVGPIFAYSITDADAPSPRSGTPQSDGSNAVVSNIDTINVGTVDFVSGPTLSQAALTLSNTFGSDLGSLTDLQILDVSITGPDAAQFLIYQADGVTPFNPLIDGPATIAAGDDLDLVLQVMTDGTSYIGDFNAFLTFLTDQGAANGGNGADFQFALLATQTPEPASLAIWTLLGLSLAGCGVYRRRCKK
jgi:hypothetical protein